MKAIKNLLLVLGFGLLSATATAQNPETGALMTDPNVGCAYGYGQYGYMNCGGGSGGSSGSARPQPPKVINRYGAVALNKSGGSFGSVRMASSEQEAIQGALADCGGKGCSIFSSYKNQCVAMAWGKKNRGGMNFQAFSLQSSDAENSALKKCTTSKAQNCQIVLSECSKYR